MDQKSFHVFSTVFSSMLPELVYLEAPFSLCWLRI